MTLIFTKLPKAEQTADRKHAYSHIECNLCGKRAPSPSQLKHAFGIQGDGWIARGGVHLCPKHADHDTVNAAAPEYRNK